MIIHGKTLTHVLVNVRGKHYHYALCIPLCYLLLYLLELVTVVLKLLLPFKISLRCLPQITIYLHRQVGKKDQEGGESQQEMSAENQD